MTAHQYLEMCEMLNEEVVPDNIPVDFQDFPLIVQCAFDVYNSLQDNWDSINGTYHGKLKSGIKEVMSLLGIDEEDYREVFLFINLIDRVRSQQILEVKSSPQRAPAS